MTQATSRMIAATLQCSPIETAAVQAALGFALVCALWGVILYLALGVIGQ